MNISKHQTLTRERRAYEAELMNAARILMHDQMATVRVDGVNVSLRYNGVRADVLGYQTVAPYNWQDIANTEISELYAAIGEAVDRMRDMREEESERELASDFPQRLYAKLDVIGEARRFSPLGHLVLAGIVAEELIKNGETLEDENIDARTIAAHFSERPAEDGDTPNGVDCWAVGYGRVLTCE